MIVSSKYLDLLIIITFVIISGGFAPQLSGILQANSNGTGSIRYQILYTLIYTTFILLAVRFGLLAEFQHLPMRFFAPIGLLIFWTLASSSWSAIPLVSLRNGLALVGTVAMAYSIALLVRDPEHVITLIILSTLICGIFSLLLANQNIGFFGDGTTPGMRGIFAHKNGLGMAMSLGIVMSVAKILRRFSFWLMGSIALFIPILVLSQSATALLAGILSSLVCIIAWILTKNGQKGRQIIGLLFTTFLLLLTVSSLILSRLNLSIVTVFLNLIGKNSTFTGRTSIWKVTVDALEGRYLLTGYGYNSFWSQLAGGNIERSFVGFKAHNSHNGYLEIALSLGIVGVILYFSILLNVFRASLDLSEFFPLTTSILIWIMIVNSMESIAWSQNSYLTVILLLLPIMVYLAGRGDQTAKNRLGQF